MIVKAKKVRETHQDPQRSFIEPEEEPDEFEEEPDEFEEDLDMVKVPNVISLSEDEAKKRIEAAGLKVGNIVRYVVDTPYMQGIVLSQKPAAGQKAYIGQSIDLMIGSYEASRPYGTGARDSVVMEQDKNAVHGTSARDLLVIEQDKNAVHDALRFGLVLRGGPDSSTITQRSTTQRSTNVSCPDNAVPDNSVRAGTYSSQAVQDCVLKPGRGSNGSKKSCVEISPNEVVDGSRNDNDALHIEPGAGEIIIKEFLEEVQVEDIADSAAPTGPNIEEKMEYVEVWRKEKEKELVEISEMALGGEEKEKRDNRLSSLLRRKIHNQKRVENLKTNSRNDLNKLRRLSENEKEAVATIEKYLEACNVEAAFFFVKRKWEDANEKSTKKGYKRIWKRLLTFLVKRELCSDCFKTNKGSTSLLASKIRGYLSEEKFDDMYNLVLDKTLVYDRTGDKELNKRQKAMYESYKRIRTYLEE